jgi:hypothetical protein
MGAKVFFLYIYIYIWVCEKVGKQT